MRTQRAWSSIRHQRGFTLLEGVAVVVVLGVLIWLGVKVIQALKGTSVITGTFTNTTPEILLGDGGGSGRFVFTMTRTVSGQPSAAIPNRKITFAITPTTGGALIASVTDALGSPQTVNAASTSLGETDATGNVTVQIQTTVAGQYSLTATDVTSSSNEATTFEVKAP